MNSRNYCTTDYNILLNHGFMAATSTLKMWYLKAFKFWERSSRPPPPAGYATALRETVH